MKILEKLLKKNASNPELEKVGINRSDIFDALAEICDDNNSPCTDSCPVFRLNGNVPLGEDLEKCKCLRNGNTMATFIILKQHELV